VIPLLNRSAAAAGGVLIILGAWWMTALATHSARLPSPLEVVRAIGADFISIESLQYTLYTTGGIYDNLQYTIQNVLMGVWIGSCLGLALGIVIGRSWLARELLEYPLLVFGTIPVMILLPFVTLWFGTDRLAQNGLVIFYSALTVVVATQNATMQTARHFEEYAVSLGAGRARVLWSVILPAIIPELIGAIRVSLAAGWGFEAMAEILGAPAGAGRIIQAFSVAVMTPNLIGVVLCIGAVAVIADAIVAHVGRWIVRWQE
jgi:ABC-type nitrate/sulfonate/bicarbonate transport system permease component